MQSKDGTVPPLRMGIQTSIPLKDIWSIALPRERRAETLRVLSRLAANQLNIPSQKEECHETN